jgi:hypothetical protein
MHLVETLAQVMVALVVAHSHDIKDMDFEF